MLSDLGLGLHPVRVGQRVNIDLFLYVLNLVISVGVATVGNQGNHIEWRGKQLVLANGILDDALVGAGHLNELFSAKES